MTIYNHKWSFITKKLGDTIKSTGKRALNQWKSKLAATNPEWKKFDIQKGKGTVFCMAKIINFFVKMTKKYVILTIF